MQKQTGARATPRVVLVDDVPDIRRVVQEIIALLAYPVLATTDTPTAVSVWAADPQSILVADGTLLNEYVASLRSLLEPHAHRLVVMSGYQPRDLPDLVSLPGSTFLHKPFTIHELHAVLQGIALLTERAVGSDGRHGVQ